MKQLQTGEFHGQTNSIIQLSGLTLTDIQYTHDTVDWHYHENAYFTFILQGKVIEGNKKEVYTCTAGSLLFHNWQEPHYNRKPKGFTRGFHIELQQSWLDGFGISLGPLTGSISIVNPDLKLLLYRIFRETKTDDAVAMLSIQTLLLQLLGQLLHDSKTAPDKKPSWVAKITEMLHDRCSDPPALTELAAGLQIHPVHLSRDFPKHFQCSLGDYIRKLKIQKSLSLLSQKELALSAIAFDCGFADQSHFTRCFKKINGVNPLEFRRLIFS